MASISFSYVDNESNNSFEKVHIIENTEDSKALSLLSEEITKVKCEINDYLTECIEKIPKKEEQKKTKTNNNKLKANGKELPQPKKQKC